MRVPDHPRSAVSEVRELTLTARSRTSPRPALRWPHVRQCIQWTAYGGTADFQHMRVDHRGRHVGVAQQILNRTDIATGLQQVGCETVAQRVGCGRLVDVR